MINSTLIPTLVSTFRHSRLRFPPGSVLCGCQRERVIEEKRKSGGGHCRSKKALFLSFHATLPAVTFFPPLVTIFHQPNSNPRHPNPIVFSTLTGLLLSLSPSPYPLVFPLGFNLPPLNDSLHHPHHPSPTATGIAADDASERGSIGVQAYVDAVLDLASHFITRLRRYASFCRTLASHAVNAGTGRGQSNTASPTGNTPMEAWIQDYVNFFSFYISSGENDCPALLLLARELLIPICRKPSLVPLERLRILNQCHPPLSNLMTVSPTIPVRLHYIDGNYTVLPEVVEASLGPYMQSMPRPIGADAAGLLLRELELHPPAEEWQRRNMYGGPWSDPEDFDDNSKAGSSPLDVCTSVHSDVYPGVPRLWSRKCRLSERDAAFGLNTSVGLGTYLGITGSRRAVIRAVWKTCLEGIWYKCMRCLRQTSAFHVTWGCRFLESE
ncbi:hypothetical protein MLD38_039878 [Melastoma candidum]|uniref:Uncharacterized protein n=1 Tax=Melastoma candidum TaxID=119954 RepID=A0ACB9L473_9MYRT|nr:hypothetical protein MLD38_039878 [Melastoma candidum]